MKIRIQIHRSLFAYYETTMNAGIGPMYDLETKIRLV